MTKKAWIPFVLCAAVAMALAAQSFAAPILLAPQSQPQTQEQIDLNSASAEELTSLPGIGQTVAERIVAYRESNGPFRKKEELMNVRGIGEKTFLKLESMIRVQSQSKKK